MYGVPVCSRGGAVMTNRMYFTLSCNREDLCAVHRYAMWDLTSRFGNAPFWEREEILEKWLDEPFDQLKWAAAKRAPKHS